MLKQFWDWFSQAFLITKDVSQLQKQFTDMERRLDEQSTVLRDVVWQMKHERELWEREKRILMLEMEREIAKLERRLPSKRED
jgi:hypothetical protein